ncbi:MAG TPA: hypothetical protein VLF61_02525 [Rhabdochlamydiaceae bacterium]|nr:hypothetical protein [Rhabdochlamydiaceae bacterium]
MSKEGILVGADRKVEWLLNFWWSHYKKYNALPVTFIDFGMSSKAKKWCAARGTVVPLDQEAPVISKSKIDPERAKRWEEAHGKQVWEHRKSWYKKPFALLLTPYERTLWLDLDCEVLGPLSGLFEFCTGDIALVREPEAAHRNEKSQGQLLPQEILYNSGVILYRKNAPLIQLWAQAVQEQNGTFWGDQQLLSRLIHLNRFKVRELPPEYNWRMSQGVHFHAFIVHWVGSWGKEFIRKYGGLTSHLLELK